MTPEYRKCYGGLWEETVKDFKAAPCESPTVWLLEGSIAITISMYVNSKLFNLFTMLPNLDVCKMNCVVYTYQYILFQEEVSHRYTDSYQSVNGEITT